MPLFGIDVFSSIVYNQAMNLYARGCALHRRHFQRDPAVVAHAPGRVEVLGNHTDYNDGFVLSAAIDAGVTCTLSLREDMRCRAYSEMLDCMTSFNLQSCKMTGRDGWANYLVGMFHMLVPESKRRFGFDIGVVSDLPLGAGLSSSAALEVAAGLTFAHAYGIETTPLDLAKAGRAAEECYAGVRCGLLDQITSIFGEEQALVFSDFRSLEIRPLTIPEAWCFLLADTGVKHRLQDSAYNERRKACERAVAEWNRLELGPIHALRDISVREWVECAGRMSDDVRPFATHVIYENDRVLRATEAIKRQDLQIFGDLMFASHESSRSCYQNSCRELDFIVQYAQSNALAEGARLSGGGFGGSAVLLLEKPGLERLTGSLQKAFEKTFNRPLTMRPVFPSAGAQLRMALT